MNKIIDIEQLCEVMRMITQESGEVLKHLCLMSDEISTGS